jgi:hypothetical protein
MQCLPKHIVNNFLMKLKDGTITPEKMLAMTSEQRRAFLGDIVGKENAQWVNTLFESKLILKNQQRGIITWAKTVGGLKPEAQKDIISRVNKMTDILTPETEDSFLEDLAAHKLGVAVTMEEAANIVSMSKDITTKRQIMEKGKRRDIDGKATNTELEYGTAMVSFLNYVNGLKERARQKTIPQAALDYLEDPISFVNDLFGAAKSIVGSLDDSFVGRQGIKEFYRGLTGNKDAAKNWLITFKQSIEAIGKTFKGRSAIDALSAEIWSDPEIDLIKQGKVAVGVTEEQYPVNWPEKIPVFGKAFKAGEEAWITSAQGMRYRAFKNYLKVWRNSEVDLSKQELLSIGKLVNSLTARGDTGINQKPGLVNNLLWSPRNIRADIDFLTLHLFDKGFSTMARKQAGLNLLRMIMGTAIILAIADLLDDESVTWDTKSYDFGKIKVGSTRFSVAGSLPGYVTLASRIVNKARTSTEGKTIRYNQGKYGESTLKDAVFNFFENKSSPPARFIMDWLEGKDFNGNKFNVYKEILQTGTPMIISNYIETAKAEDSANMALIVLAETFGINTSTYETKSSTYKRPKFDTH